MDHELESSSEPDEAQLLAEIIASCAARLVLAELAGELVPVDDELGDGRRP